MDHELDFPAGIWEAFAKSRPPVRCSPGYLIYLQDAEATCFYYLNSGRVKSFIQSEDGAERVLNVYRAGSLFGEASFFDELPRVSSAVALTPCEIVPIDRELVAQEFAKDPELARPGQVDQMAFRPARWRVASCLLALAGRDGRVSCTQEDIAAAVSASRVTVSRVLGDFAGRGWVELGYRSISLLEPEKLKEIM